MTARPKTARAKNTNGAKKNKIKKAVDWNKGRSMYESGLYSIREVSKMLKIAHSTLLYKVKQEGWTNKRLKSRIINTAEDFAYRREVEDSAKKEGRRITDDELCKKVAQGIAEIILAERKDISKARAVVQNLFLEVSIMNDNPEMLLMLKELVLTDEIESKALELYQKVTSLPSRIDGAQKLANALKTLIMLERDVYGIKDTDGTEEKRHKSIGIRLIPTKHKPEDEEEEDE